MRQTQRLGAAYLLATLSPVGTSLTGPCVRRVGRWRKIGLRVMPPLQFHDDAFRGYLSG